MKQITNRTTLALNSRILSKKMEKFAEKRPAWFLCVILSFMLLVASSRELFAFRPFETEDAAVVDNGDVELEFGFSINEQKQKIGDEVTIDMPIVSLTFGLPYDIELSADLTMEFVDEDQGDGFHSTLEQLTGAGLNVKKVWMRGKGIIPDIATQTSILFPTEKRARGVDIEHSFIYTWKLPNLLFHTTIGGGSEHVDEEDMEKDVRGRYFYGSILDYNLPLQGNNYHLVAEYFAERTINEPLEHQMLIGTTIDLPKNIKGDFAVFWGLNHQSIDRGATFGVTIGW